MRQLHFVGFTSDNDGLIVAERRGSKTGSFVIRLDDGLLEQIDQVRLEIEAQNAPPPPPRPARPRVESGLSPREMQTRLRGGRTVSQVAAEAGVDIEWVERFAAPILAEQSLAVSRALEMVVRTQRRGNSDRGLSASVLRNLADRGIRLAEDEFESAWSAFQLADNEWVIRFRYRSRGREQQAEWLLDAAAGTLSPHNRLGTEMGYVDPGRHRPPVRDLPPVRVRGSVRRRRRVKRALAKKSAPPTKVSAAKKGTAARKASSRKRLAGTNRSARSAKKAPVKKGPVKKRAVKKIAVKKSAAKKTAVKASGARKRSPAKRAVARKAAPPRKASASKRATTAKRVGASKRVPVKKRSVTVKKAASAKKVASSRKLASTRRAATARKASPPRRVSAAKKRTAVKRATPAKKGGPTTKSATARKRTGAKRTPAVKKSGTASKAKRAGPKRSASAKRTSAGKKSPVRKKAAPAAVAPTDSIRRPNRPLQAIRMTASGPALRPLRAVRVETGRAPNGSRTAIRSRSSSVGRPAVQFRVGGPGDQAYPSLRG